MQDTSITSLKGIGEKKAAAFGRLGVRTLYDLINLFPSRYEDRTVFKSISDTCDGDTCCISAVVIDAPRLARIRRGMELLKFRVTDNTGSVDITFFNQSYLKNGFSRGDEFVFYGKIEVNGTRRSMSNPSYEKAGSEEMKSGRLVPVYPLSAGLNQKSVRSAVLLALDSVGEDVPDYLPERIKYSNGLMDAASAYRGIHFPDDNAELEAARHRMVFEELFVLSCAFSKLRQIGKHKSGISAGEYDFSEFCSSLPYSPTGAQLKAIDECAADMKSGFVMNRLLQGDVGSGKTLVAAALCRYMKVCGYCSAMMAPTEILAEQHLKTLRGLLVPFGMTIELLTGSTSAPEKRRIKDRLKNGEIDVIIGTHALLTEDMEIAGLGLVITDEQHRFGVNQRAALIGKGDSPHVLVMSATPIPRTLSLYLYGDLDISILDEMPPGRQKVDTFAVNETYRSRLNSFIQKQVDGGHQVFIVCPAVEEDEDRTVDIKSAEEYSAELKITFPRLRIACIHGKMKAKEKEAIMSAVSAGDIDVLVSTTVIEVGVDVPNATLMIIENAERFGLSQLHQLRGRVGRGDAKSYCVLVSDSKGPEAKARLDIMCKTNDGFRISEEDLKIRGPGDFFGSRQHGLPVMHAASLGTDSSMLKSAREQADALLEFDPDLSLPEHAALKLRIDNLFTLNADSMN